MFMVKDEYLNIKKLLNVKIKAYKNNLIWFFIVVLIIFISNLVQTVANVLFVYTEGIKSHIIQDYSYIFFFSLLFAYFILMLLYRNTNNYLSVFPQTNNSRFITSQILNCLIAVMVGTTVLIMYLLDYTIFSIISYFKNGIYLIYDFDVGFIIVGFITFMIYSFIIIAISGLIGAVLLKWRYYAIVSFTLIVSLIISNFKKVIEYAPKLFAFLLNEPKPVLFIIKGIGLCIIINVISLVINNNTIYYKSQKKITASKLVIFCTTIGITPIISIILLNHSYTNSSTNSSINLSMVDEIDEKYISKFEKIRIDVSHLPKGSKIKIEGDNIFIPYVSTAYSIYDIAVNNTELLNSLQGDTIVINYSLPEHYVYDYAMSKFTKPEITINLAGDTLYINYTYENADVIFLPIWSIAKQFECYKNKNLIDNFMIYGSGHRPGIINITIE